MPGDGVGERLLIGSQAANRAPLPPKAELAWWYQFYFATERGRAGYEANRNDFNKLIWHLASPKWDFDDATYDRSAPSFANPDHVAVVIHNYRWRLGLVQGEPSTTRSNSASRQDRPSRSRPSRWKAMPTARPSRPSAYAKKFTGKYRAPEHRRRDRTQPSARSAKSVRRCGDRCRAYGVIGSVVKRLADRACHRMQVAGVDGRHAARRNSAGAALLSAVPR